MFENPRRGRQARNFTKNGPKILDLKSSSEQIFSRKLPLGAPVPSSLQSAFVTNGYEKGLWRTTNNLSKKFVPLRVQGESRFQVSRKVAFTLKYLFFAISNNLFTFVLWNSLKNGSRDLYRVNGAVQAHWWTKLSLFAQCKLNPATSGLVQAER